MPPRTPGKQKDRRTVPRAVYTELTPQTFWELYKQDRLQPAQKILIMLGIPKQEQDQDQQTQITQQDLENQINTIWNAKARSPGFKHTFEKKSFAPHTSFEKAPTPAKLAFILHQVMYDMLSASGDIHPPQNVTMEEAHDIMTQVLHNVQKNLDPKINALKQCTNWPNCTELLQQATTTETTSPISSILVQFSPLWDMITAKESYKEKLESIT